MRLFEILYGRGAAVPSFENGTVRGVFVSVPVREAMKKSSRSSRASGLVIAACLLAACGGGDSSTNSDSTSNSDGNHAPTLSGSPLGIVLYDFPYDFKPSAADADGDVITFSVTNLPSWATFDKATGHLSGTPGQGDIGTYSNVTVTASDGLDSTTLGPFSIEVVAVGNGSATLSWTAPTQRTDGTALTDLAGYKLYWGVSKGNYVKSVVLNTGQTNYVVDGLTPATWYFVATAFDSSGVESTFSNPASKTVN